MKKLLICSHGAVFIVGLVAGLFLAVWLYFEPVHAGEPKYHLGMGSPRLLNPTGEWRHPRRYIITCIGSEKECGTVTKIPEPGTLILLVGGLVLLGANKWR